MAAFDGYHEIKGSVYEYAVELVDGNPNAAAVGISFDGEVGLALALRIRDDEGHLITPRRIGAQENYGGLSVIAGIRACRAAHKQIATYRKEKADAEGLA